MTARNYLRKICGLTARSMTVLKAAEGGITCGGVLLRSCDTVNAGDVIEIRLPDDVNEIEPAAGTLQVIYEDDYLLVVNKPPMMPVHPTKVHQLDTLANVISYYQHSKGENYTFRALNRIDKDTSGCVLIAKDRLSYAMVSDIEKRYFAVCEGLITSPGTIDSPISLQHGSKIVRCVSSSGQRAVTHYAPLATGGGHTLLQLKLETGRTHQIRCHLSSIGHPIAGDDLYGGNRSLIQRQALHCRDVSFCHPMSRAPLSLSAEVPQDIDKLLRKCGII